MNDEFLINIKTFQAVEIPATENLFKVDGSKPLNKNKAELFHKTVDRGLFLCKINKSDIHPTIAFLCPRAKQTNQGDWNKLLRLMKYLVGTQELCIILKADKKSCLKCYLDAAFVVHFGF